MQKRLQQLKEARRRCGTLFLMEKLMKLVSTRTWYGGPSCELYLKKSAVGVFSLRMHGIAPAAPRQHFCHGALCSALLQPSMQCQGPGLADTRTSRGLGAGGINGRSGGLTYAARPCQSPSGSS